MSNEQLQATARLADQKVKFEATASGKPSVTFDYVPPLGEGEGYMPLEMLLMSLASCSGASVAALLRRMGKDVAGLEVRAVGERRNQHPLSFKSILLAFDLTSDDATPEDLQKAVLLSEQQFCPLWPMLRESVEIKSESYVGSVHN